MRFLTRLMVYMIIRNKPRLELIAGATIRSHYLHYLTTDQFSDTPLWSTE